MGINEIIMYIMMFFMLIAAVDRILSQFGGSARFLGKLGKSIEGSGGQFEEGFMAMGALGLAAAVIKFLLGWELIPGLDPIFMAPGDQPGEVMRAIEVIGSISCVLLGAYPMVLLLTRWFEKPLMRVGNLLKINNMAAGGMVATLANNIPMFGMMKQMDTRGKVINCAFSVSAAFALGDHLGFAAANMNAMIFPMIVGKLVGGVTAIGVAMLLVPKDENVPAPANNEAEAHS
ncbi:TPA: ethanolamine utilization protein EutH [Klebsiella pneumoniae]|nr:ethanolamine utilization protein EutH [Klebsiella pneumoniae]